MDNLLILFDCWINCYYYIPRMRVIYTLGAILIRKKWFPNFIADAYFNILKKTKINKKRAYREFNKLLNESVLLHLNLKEKIDFKIGDIDEIKARNYEKRHLELMGYSKKYSSLENNYMDEWNSHCLSNHIIDSNKIKLCFLNDSSELKNIFYYAVKETTIDLKKVCPVLYDYLTNCK